MNNTNWTRFETPIPINLYDITPGVQIEVEYTYGAAASPKKMRATYLIGDTNEKGGRCECCGLDRESNCVVLAERVLVDPVLLED